MELDWNKITRGQMFLASMQYIHECQRCGKCCTGMQGIAVNRIDRIRMAKELGISEKEFMYTYTDPSPKKASDRLYKLVGEDRKCPFLGEKGCEHYNGRGQVCRFYPWASPENMEQGRLNKPCMINERCVGMMITYTHVLDDAETMSESLADAMLKSETGKLMFLHVVNMEGRGDAFINRMLKSIGLDAWPPEDIMFTMAYQYAVATCTKILPEVRAKIRSEMNEFIASRDRS